jgi:hypothetical protein
VLILTCACISTVQHTHHKHLCPRLVFFNILFYSVFISGVLVSVSFLSCILPFVFTDNTQHTHPCPRGRFLISFFFLCTLSVFVLAIDYPAFCVLYLLTTHITNIHATGKETGDTYYRMLNALQDRSGRVRKISPPAGFDSRAFQFLASRYTDCAIPAHRYILYVMKLTLLRLEVDSIKNL